MGTSTHHSYAIADNNNQNASLDNFDNTTTDNMIKVDREINKTNQRIDDMPITHVSETEPEEWKAGDYWFQIIRERTIENE